MAPMNMLNSLVVSSKFVESIKKVIINTECMFVYGKSCPNSKEWIKSAHNQIILISTPISTHQYRYICTYMHMHDMPIHIHTHIVSRESTYICIIAPN